MITTFTGPMHSGKTSKMIDVYNNIYNKEHILCFKPIIDNRDNLIIKSKDYDEGIPALGINKFEDILKFIDDKTRIIFIDEVQMLTGNVGVLTYLSIVRDIDIYTAGLNMTSEQKPFLSMPDILAISDEVYNISASCFDCGREAMFTYYEGEKTDQILVGDTGYLPLCRKCLINRRNKIKTKKLLLDEN